MKKLFQVTLFQEKVAQIAKIKCKTIARNKVLIPRSHFTSFENSIQRDRHLYCALKCDIQKEKLRQNLRYIRRLQNKKL
jgi:hypothetical protein